MNEVPKAPSDAPRTGGAPHAVVVEVQQLRPTPQQVDALCSAGIWPPVLPVLVEVVAFYPEAR